MGASNWDSCSDITPAGATYHADRGAREDRVRPRCWLHKLDGVAGEHPIWRCDEFMAESAKARRELVIAHKACLCCLLPDCTGVEDPAKCGRKFKCLACHGLHNSRLHIDTKAVFHTNDSGSQNGNAILPTQNL